MDANGKRETDAVSSPLGNNPSSSAASNDNGAFPPSSHTTHMPPENQPHSMIQIGTECTAPTRTAPSTSSITSSKNKTNSSLADAPESSAFCTSSTTDATSSNLSAISPSLAPSYSSSCSSSSSLPSLSASTPSFVPSSCPSTSWTFPQHTNGISSRRGGRGGRGVPVSVPASSFFSFARYRPSPPFTSSRRPAARVVGATSSISRGYLKERFVQANFRLFVKKPSHVASALVDPDAFVPWAKVVAVDFLYSSNHGIHCPVCLDEQFTAPQITKCGHVYCCACILRYLREGDVLPGKRTCRKCPLCFELVASDELRPVRLHQVRRLSLDDRVSFCLIERCQGSTVASLAAPFSAHRKRSSHRKKSNDEHPPHPHSVSLPSENSLGLHFARLAYIEDPTAVWLREIEQLHRQREEAVTENEEGALAGIDEGIRLATEKLLEHTKGSKRYETREDSKRKESDDRDQETTQDTLAVSENAERVVSAEARSIMENPKGLSRDPTGLWNLQEISVEPFFERIKDVHRTYQDAVVAQRQIAAALSQKKAATGHKKHDALQPRAVPPQAAACMPAPSAMLPVVLQKEAGSLSALEVQGTLAGVAVLAPPSPSCCSFPLSSPPVVCGASVASSSGTPLGMPASFPPSVLSPSLSGASSPYLIPSPPPRVSPSSPPAQSPPVFSTPQTGTQGDASGLLRFYQASDGQLAFLEPFLYRCLVHEHALDPLGLPPVLTNMRVLGLREFLLEAATRKKYTFLSHLPLASPVTLVECDVDQLISEETKNAFRDEFARRASRRREEKNRRSQETRQEKLHHRRLVAERRAQAAAVQGQGDRSHFPSLPTSNAPTSGADAPRPATKHCDTSVSLPPPEVDATTEEPRERGEMAEGVILGDLATSGPTFLEILCQQSEPAPTGRSKTRRQVAQPSESFPALPSAALAENARQRAQNAPSPLPVQVPGPHQWRPPATSSRLTAETIVISIGRPRTSPTLPSIHAATTQNVHSAGPARNEALEEELSHEPPALRSCSLADILKRAPHKKRKASK